jgi:hypothetical protein
MPVIGDEVLASPSLPLLCIPWWGGEIVGNE